MMLRTYLSGLMLALAAGLSLPATVRADDPPPKTEIIDLPLRPALPSEPGTSAKRLIYLPTEQMPGNAALLYLKAMVSLKENRTLADEMTKIVGWLEKPLDQLPKDNDENVPHFYTAMQICRLAAKRTECNWGSPVIGEEDFYGVVLPEVQACRELARIIAFETRLAIAAGRWDDAIDDLRIGFALARHIGRQQTLVSGLVGYSVASMMLDQIEALETAGGPNLYWALAELPRPLIDMTPAAAIESQAPFLAFPQLAKVRDAQWAAGQWDVELKQFHTEWLIRMRDWGELVEKHVGDPFKDAAIEQSAAYARKHLSPFGYDSKEIDAMSPAEAVLRYVAARCAAQGDDILRSWHLPLAEGRIRAAASARHFVDSADQPRELRELDLGRFVLPAVSQCLESQLRSERRLAAARVIEAIRADARKMQLPERLDAITTVPVPEDPASGEPFTYKLEGDKATLSLPALSEGKPAREYRLSLSRGK
jgi:hypothetical protein